MCRESGPYTTDIVYIYATLLYVYTATTEEGLREMTAESLFVLRTQYAILLYYICMSKRILVCCIYLYIV